MSSAQEAMLQLLSGQCEATARTIATKFGLDVNECLAEVATHVESMDLTSFTKGRKKPAKKGTRKPAEPGERCLARVWGTGSGSDQCKLGRCDNSDYCKRHDKANKVESTPCTLVPWSEESRCGKKTGLFCGRIDHDVPVADSHGVIRILWKNPDVVKIMEQKIAEGEWRMPTGHKPKRKAKKSVDDSATLEKLPSATASHSTKTESDGIAEAFTTQPDDAAVVVAPADEPVAVVEAPPSASVVEASEPLSPAVVAVEEPTGESTNPPVKPPATSNKTEAISEEEIACEEREHNGTVYLVEPSSNAIYNEDGDLLGTWTADGPKLS